MKHRIEYLDGLRGVFALCIALSHFMGGAMGWRNYPFVNAYIAVDFFFILSGFVLCYVYAESFQTGRMNNTIFSLHRFARMYPLHIATLFITFLIYYFIYENFPFERPLYSGLANLLLLHGMGMTSDWSWNDPSWSISVEFWASVLAFRVLVQKLNNTALFFFAFICYTLVFNKHNSLMAAFDFTYFYLSSGFLKCIGGMALGILIYKLSSNAVQTPISNTILVGLIDASLFLVIMIFMSINISIPKFDILMIACAAILIYRLNSGSSWFRTLIETKPFCFLGKISFSLYLIHTPILLLLGQSSVYSGLPLFIKLTLFLTSTFFISYILCNLFEKRLYKTMKKIIDKKLKSPTTVINTSKV